MAHGEHAVNQAQHPHQHPDGDGQGQPDEQAGDDVFLHGCPWSSGLTQTAGPGAGVALALSAAGLAALAAGAASGLAGAAAGAGAPPLKSVAYQPEPLS